MSTIRRSRAAISAVAAMLVVALSAPIIGTAEDQVLVEEQVLVAEDQVPSLGPVSLVPAVSTHQVPSDVRWAPGGAIVPVPGSLVEASYEAGEVQAAPPAGPPPQPTYIPASSASRAPEQDVGPPPQHAYSPESSAPPPLREALSSDYLPAALASGWRAESAHLATLALPDDGVRAASDDRIAALFGDQASADGSVVAPCIRTSTRTCTQR
jgi:hypothetical protein